MQQRNLYLDIARSLAMFSVLFTHWSGWTAIPSILTEISKAINLVFNALFWKGSLAHPGVVLFIVLSGFLLHLPQSIGPKAVIPTKQFWATFLMRRFVRLIPVYWFASLCGIVVLVLMTAYPQHVPDFAMSDNLSEAWSLLDVIARLTLLDVFIFQKTRLLGNGPLVIVEVLFWIYVAYPVVYALQRKIGWRFILIGALLLQIVSVLISYAIGVLTIGTQVLYFLLFWCIGASAIDYYSRQRPATKKVVAAVVALFLLYVALSNASPVTGRLSPLVRYVTSILLAMFLAATMVYLFSRRERVLSTAPVRSIITSCSEISYSVYAIHTPVLIAVLMLDKHLLLTGIFWHQLMPLLAVFLFAWLTYAVIERPTHFLARKLFPC